MNFIKQSTIVVNGKRRKNIKRRLIIAVALIIIDVVLFTYLFRIHFANEEFAKQATEFYRLNAKTIFSIDKIYMYSSAGAVDNKDTRAIWNLDLYQYTDIAIYINNRSSDKLTYENSIKSLYIDNIKFTKVSKGMPSLYYKNVNEFGKSVYNTALEETSTNVEQSQENSDNTEQNQENSDNQEQNNNPQDIQKSKEQLADESAKRKQIIENLEKTKLDDRLEFSILNDGDLDYSKPQLYTDCSSPITLEYMNSKIKENELISDINNDVIFDGNLLRKSGVVLSDIACTLSFNINLTNYYNQRFIATVYIDIPLEDTTSGENIYAGKFVRKIENTNFVRFFRLE